MLRIQRILLIAAAAAALATPSAQAHTTISCASCLRPYQHWIEEAKVPTPNATLTVIETSEAVSSTEEGTSTIWLNLSALNVRQAFYHELGHNFDYLMPEWVRTRYLAILGRKGPWRQPEALHFSPHELFAESYALCAFRSWLPPGGEIQGQEPVGGRIVHNRTCHLIGVAAKYT